MPALEERIAEEAIARYVGRKIAEEAGKYTGADVVALTKCAVEYRCKGKTGWNALACIVDEMDKVYEEADEYGVDEALRRLGCPEKRELVR